MRLFVIIFIALFSCTGNSTLEGTNTTQDTALKGSKDHTENKPGKPVIGNATGCYWQILKRDTLVASLSQNGNEVTGKLSFDNFEKDGSSGMVTGKIDNGIIKLWYNFESEGMKSVMEVWLKQQGDLLYRGTGNMDIKGDSNFFTDPAHIDFTGNQQMRKVDCSDVPSKYKQL